MILHKLVPLFALGLNLLLIASALAADRKSPLNRSFAYFATAQAIWNFGVLGLRWSVDPTTAVQWEVLVHLGVIPIPVLFYRYVIVFLDLPTRRASLVAGYTLCVFFLSTSATPLFMRGVQETYWGWAPVSGPLYAPFFVYFQAYMVLGLVRLMRGHRVRTSSFWRNRSVLVIAGVVVSLLGGAVDFLRFILNLDRLYPLGIPGNAVLALALGLAIVRYRLLDLGVLAKRLLLYVFASMTLAPLFVGYEFLLDRFRPVEMANRHFIDGLVHLVALSLVLPVLRMLERGLERVMFQRQHGVREALLALSKEMSSVLDVRRLGETLTTGLVARIPVLRASLHLYDAGSKSLVPFAQTISAAFDGCPPADRLDPAFALWLRLSGKTMVVGEAAFHAVTDPRFRTLVRKLEVERTAALVPMFLEGELAAVLVLGEKLSGEIFSPSEIELLEMLMGQTAIALKNSRLYDDLRAQMNELRTTQQQLMQSAKLAAIGELAASVAHEINNPLTVILGSSALLLKQTAAGSSAHTKITNIVTAANRAGKIVRDLLDFSRRREPRREPLDLAELIARSLDIVQFRLASGGVEVQTAFDPRVTSIIGDRDQLTQVFINLIGNGVDAMPNGGRLSVETHALPADGMVAIDIRDTGIGMDRDQIARIFEPFFTTKAEGRGTGLGLSVTLGIVAKHGGTIEVRSEPGRGTTMRVRLPAATAGDTGDDGLDAAGRIAQVGAV